MKKSLRKLSLSRETLHTLEHLSQIAGGAPPYSNTAHTCPDHCDPIHLLTERC